MKFSCTQENLHQGLSVVSHIANKNVNLPILGNVLVKAEDSGLKFMATNLEIAVSCMVRGKVEERGEFTVPSKLFSDYVGLLPKERVDVAQDGNAFTVECGTYQTRLNGIVASEFPLIPSVERQKGFTVKVADFKRSVSQVLFAVAPNESRPEISGVLFRFSPDGSEMSLTLAATDSYRLAEKTLEVITDQSSKLDEALSVIVPARTVAELMRILGVFRDSIDDSESIEIFIAENQILFVYANVELVSRTIEGRYPDYRQLIPDTFQTEVIVAKDELVRAVKATSLFSKNGLNDIQISFAEGAPIKITAMNTLTGEHEAEVKAEVKGKENAVTVNFRYFLDGVNNMETDEVRIRLIDGISPCLLQPNTKSEQESQYQYIVMPIRQ